MEKAEASPSQPAQSEPREGEVLTRDNVLSPPAIAALGLMCARALQAVGVVTLIVRPDLSIGYVSPQDVYLDRNAAVVDPENEKRPVRYVRPVLSDGKPHYVGWKDGALWEVEFVDTEEKPDGG